MKIKRLDIATDFRGPVVITYMDLAGPPEDAVGLREERTDAGLAPVRILAYILENRMYRDVAFVSDDPEDGYRVVLFGADADGSRIAAFVEVDRWALEAQA